MEGHQIVVVCHANYCRSPVGEHLLENKFRNTSKFLFKSAGISPISIAEMDKRSREFLISKKSYTKSHFPKLLTKQLIKSSSLVLVMGNEVLFQLNNLHPEFKKKFKAFNYYKPSLYLNDPYNFDAVKYKEIMENIEEIVNIFNDEKLMNLINF